MYVAELCVAVVVNDLDIVYEILKIAQDHINRGGRLYRASVDKDNADAHLSSQVQHCCVKCFVLQHLSNKVNFSKLYINKFSMQQLTICTTQQNI